MAKKTVALPEAARDKVPDHVVEQLPPAVEPPVNVVSDPERYVPNDLYGTAGRDYFVVEYKLFDPQVLAWNTIWGFEQGRDKIAIVNLPPDGGFSLLVGDFHLGNAALPDTRVQVNYYEYAVVVDVALTGTDVVTYADNPFA